MDRDDLTSWSRLDAEAQLALRLDYQAHLDSLPPTCSLDDKVAAFADWLARRGIAFEMSDLSRKQSR